MNREEFIEEKKVEENRIGNRKRNRRIGNKEERKGKELNEKIIKMEEYRQK